MKVTTHKLGLDWLVVANILLVCVYSPFIAELTLIHLVSAGLSLVVVALAIVDILMHEKIRWYHLILIFGLIYLTIIVFVYVVAGSGINQLVRAYLPFFYLPSFALVCLCLNQTQARKLLKTLLFVGVIASLAIIPFFVELKLGRLPYNRFTAYTDLSHTPLFLMALPLCYCLLKSYRYLAVTIIMLAIFSTQSKGQILLSFLAIAMCEVFSTRNRVMLLLKMVLIVIICSIPFFAYKDVIAKRFVDIGGSTTSHRLVEIQAAGEIFQDKPLIGGGPTTKFDTTELVTNVDKEGQRYIHNLLMYVLATGGVVGCMFYFFPYLVIAIVKKSPEQKYILASLLCAFGYLLVSATFKSIQTNMFFGVLLGCYAIFGGLGRNEHQKTA
mgnify:CR=1 FL=1